MEAVLGAATLLEDSPRQRGWCRSSCGPALPESLPSLRPEPGPSALEPAAGGRRVEDGGRRAEPCSGRSQALQGPERAAFSLSGQVLQD